MERLKAGSERMLLAFTGIAVAFVLATVIVQRTSSEIGREATAVSLSVAPNIDALSAVRAELRHLEEVVTRQVSDGARKVVARDAEIQAVRRELEARLAGYRATTSELAQSLGVFHLSIREFDRSSERVLTLARSGADRAAIRSAIDRVHVLADQALAQGGALIAGEAERARVAGMRIAQVRERTNRAALALDALCAIAACAVGAATYRAQRRYARLQAEHGKVLEARNEELEQFAGRVAHDILGPLGTVQMALTLAERPGSSIGARSAALARGSASLQRVHRLVDGLLDFAKAGAVPQQGASTDVVPTVSGLIDELSPEAAKARVALQLSPPSVGCTVRCTPGALLSILSNLLRNAIKYMGDGPRRLVTVRVLPLKGKVRFEVEDTGSGLPPGLGEKIFHPYVRAPGVTQPGIGLGLATVKRLVDAHGGAVGARPAPEGGAIFWFELPGEAEEEIAAPIPFSQAQRV